jgi:hypothetical protein
MHITINEFGYSRESEWRASVPEMPQARILPSIMVRAGSSGIEKITEIKRFIRRENPEKKYNGIMQI